jgi:hypothetical protein
VVRALSFPGGHLTIIGGLAPALLVPQVEPGLEPHIGTLDLDMCMSVNLLAGDVGHYENLQKGLEAAGARSCAKTPSLCRGGGGRRARSWSSSSSAPCQPMARSVPAIFIDRVDPWPGSSRRW